MDRQEDSHEGAETQTVMRSSRIGALLLVAAVLAPAATHAGPGAGKLEDARTMRATAVATAKRKMNALVDNARKNGGKATGPAATWVRTTFRREPTTPFLMHLNGVLSVGLTDAKSWIEPPEPREPCESSTEYVEKVAVAERGGDTIYLCDLFYTQSAEENAITLFHEAQHLHGVGDCPSLVTGATPPDQLLCAERYQELLRYLWKTAP